MGRNLASIFHVDVDIRDPLLEMACEEGEGEVHLHHAVLLDVALFPSPPALPFHAQHGVDHMQASASHIAQ